jgi:hypothetical protein
MTKPLKYMYQIQYEDNSYRIIDWTKAEFDSVKEAMQGNFDVVCMEDGVFRLTHVRVIVKVVEEEAPKEESKSEENKAQEEWGFVDPATAQWLREQGMLGGSTE